MIKIIALFETGCCYHPEFITRKGGAWRNCRFPAISVLLEHQQHGLILIDTGYSEHFIAATRYLPYQLYRMVTPVKLVAQQSVKSQLNAMNIKPEEIRFIIISHFHGDHISGLKDFPDATYVASKKALEILEKKSKLSGLRHAFIKSLLPEDFKKRLFPIESLEKVALDSNLLPFTYAKDLFNDKSVLLIDLPGHALGHYGLFVAAPNPYFFVGDACWSSKAYQELLFPHYIAQLLFADKIQYQETILKLNQLWLTNKQIQIVPSHCSETLLSVKKRLL